MSFGSLYASTLVGATLTNTNLRGATLDHADFSGPNTRFAGTNLHNAWVFGTRFRGASITGANMQSDEALKPQVADLTQATLRVGTMLPAHWRYNTLTGAVFIDSTAACPNGSTLASGCGAITDPKWVAPVPPKEPTDCQPTAFDSQGNVIAITCTSSRHPAGG